MDVGVFHPGLFFSSKFLAGYLIGLNLRDKKCLDVGCGSGFLSLVLRREGNEVTGIDVNPSAIQNSIENAMTNKLEIDFKQSDLFEVFNGKEMLIDVMVVNPPYYKRHPKTNAEKAWFAGEDGEYFRRFFRDAFQFLKSNGQILMVLSEDCDLDFISNQAGLNGFIQREVKRKRFLWETNFIFEFRKRVE